MSFSSDISRRTAGALLFSTIAASALAGKLPKRYPLTLFRNRLFVEARVKGVPVEALLDSAAEISIVDQEFAQRSGLLTGGTSAEAKGSGAGSVEAQILEAIRVEAAGIVLPAMTVAAIDLRDISDRLAGRKIKFILGRDFFDTTRLSIDINGGWLASLPADEPSKGERFPLETQHGVETFAVRIEGNNARAEFDLGNGSLPLLGAEFARRNGLIGDGRPTGKETGGGLGGAVERTTLQLRELSIGNRVFRNVKVAVDENANAAEFNVGTKLLRQFKIVTDFANHQLWLS